MSGVAEGQISDVFLTFTVLFRLIALVDVNTTLC